MTEQQYLKIKKESNQLAEMLHKGLLPQIETILAKGGITQDNIDECNELFDDLAVLLRKMAAFFAALGNTVDDDDNDDNIGEGSQSIVSSVDKSAENDSFERSNEDNDIISLFDIKLKEAYDWAVAEQKRYGFVAQPINFVLEKDELTYDQEEVYVSLFYDKSSERAILRRDWDSSFVVQYNILANYQEFAKDWPESLKKLLNNGIDLYRRYIRAGFGK